MASQYTWEQYTDFIYNTPPPKEDLNFFSSIEWLQPYFNASSLYRPVPFFSRVEKETSLDRFFSDIIKTPDTIPHALALTRKDANWEKRLAEATANDAKSEVASKEPVEWDFILLAQLCPALSGFRDTAHGGVLGTLFDEAMGCCTAEFRNTPSERGTDLFTANLSVSYRAPVELPCVVAIRIRLVRRLGRKWFVEGDLVGSDGVVKAKAEALWISTKRKESSL